MRGKQAGDLVVGIAAAAVLPDSGGRVGTIGGRPSIADAASPGIDLTYFLGPRVALTTAFAPTRHDVAVLDSAIGDVQLGRFRIVAPNIGIQFHPFPAARLSPYVGGGVALAFFHAEGGARSQQVARVRVDGTVGPVLNAGLDLELAPHWLLNLDARKLFIRTDASVNAGAVDARVRVDPWILSAAVRYRF